MVVPLTVRLTPRKHKKTRCKNQRPKSVPFALSSTSPKRKPTRLRRRRLSSEALRGANIARGESGQCLSSVGGARQIQATEEGRHHVADLPVAESVQNGSGAAELPRSSGSSAGREAHRGEHQGTSPVPTMEVIHRDAKQTRNRPGGKISIFSSPSPRMNQKEHLWGKGVPVGMLMVSRVFCAKNRRCQISPPTQW